MRWLVGDIQGCARELDDLLGKIRFDPDRDELWSLGDFINRGPDSLAALQLWTDVGGKGVLGNHDVYALLAAAGRRKRKKDTLDPLFDEKRGRDLLQSIRDLPFLVQLGHADERVRDVILVHAGIDPRWNDLDEIEATLNELPRDDEFFESEEVAAATRLRCCLADGTRSSFSGPVRGCPPPFKPWDQFYRGHRLVVHGHWALRGYYRGERTLGLDSGCVYGGKLTAWCQEEDRIEQVPSRTA